MDLNKGDQSNIPIIKNDDRIRNEENSMILNIAQKQEGNSNRAFFEKIPQNNGNDPEIESVQELNENYICKTNLENENKILKVDHAYYEDNQKERKSIFVLNGKNIKDTEKHIKEIKKRNSSLNEIINSKKENKNNLLDERKESNSNCLICFENPSDCVLMKCGHGGFVV